VDWERWSDTLATTIAGYRPLEFFLLGYVKDKVLSTPVPNITNLKARITDAFATITEDMLESTWILFDLDNVSCTSEEFQPWIIFQQDGAPPHWSSDVRRFLDETFPNWWIGRDGPTLWPPRSPDITPLDFFSWDMLRSKCFRHQFQILQI